MSIWISSGRQILAADCREPIAHVYATRDHAIDIANARLIAAAPEMLAAIEAALASGLIRGPDPVGNPGTTTPVYDALAAALDKAYGLGGEPRA